MKNIEAAAQNYLDDMRAMALMGKVFVPGESVKEAFLAGASHERERAKGLVEALEFYADSDKYYMRESKVDLNQTTAIFKKEYKADFSKPNIHESKVYETSARIKVDQGSVAKVALEKWRME